MWCPETTMADPTYILFNKTLEQARRLGARGGRAYACNQRARRARMPPPLPTVPLRLAPRETTAEAIAVLDAQFPWLRGAGKRTSGSQPSCPLTGGGKGPCFWCACAGVNASSQDNGQPGSRIGPRYRGWRRSRLHRISPNYTDRLSC